MVNGVISQEVDNFNGRNGPGAVSINSFESRVRGEVSDAAESLSCTFEVSLAIADAVNAVVEMEADDPIAAIGRLLLSISSGTSASGGASSASASGASASGGSSASSASSWTAAK